MAGEIAAERQAHDPRRREARFARHRGDLRVDQRGEHAGDLARQRFEDDLLARLWVAVHRLPYALSRAPISVTPELSPERTSRPSNFTRLPTCTSTGSRTVRPREMMSPGRTS